MMQATARLLLRGDAVDVFAGELAGEAVVDELLARYVLAGAAFGFDFRHFGRAVGGALEDDLFLLSS